MNRDRITTLLILAAIIALVVYVAFHTYWGEDTISTPLQGEAATNQYYSVERLLHAVGVQTRQIASLRVLPPTSDVLFVNDLDVRAAHASQAALEHWVRRGGRLVITGTVDWVSSELQAWSGIAPVKKVEQIKAAKPDAECRPLVEKQQGVATGATPQFCVFALPAFRSKRVPEWALSNDDGLQMARVSMGRGSLTLIGNSYLLTPRLFLRADHAQSFVDSIPLRRGDRMLILSATKAEPFIALLWRLAAPAIVSAGIVALLLIWRHLPRFGPLAPVPIAARRSLAEQIRANARFAWRTGKLAALHAAARRALDRDAARTISAYATLDTARRAAELGKRVGVDSVILEAAMTERSTDTAPVQRAAIALLEQTRRTLTMSSRQKGTA
jgi:hypothetical protein